ncbi:MAG TPA: hypothetical protein VKA84_29165 [Gemmatimonadaceae bacterium]|nr:hypothetical protein [Gemmatimonadaceae bacterium]
MDIAVRIEEGAGAGEAPEVEYRWDADTSILTASLRAGAVSEGMSGSVVVEGSDGSWLVFDVASGKIRGVEVANWPDVRKLASLEAPTQVEEASVTLPARASQPGIASLEMDTALVADSDQSERIFHFRIGPKRRTRVVRLAKDILLDVDQRSVLAGVWLLNVPPFPAETPAEPAQ